MSTRDAEEARRDAGLADVVGRRRRLRPEADISADELVGLVVGELGWALQDREEEDPDVEGLQVGRGDDAEAGSCRVHVEVEGDLDGAPHTGLESVESYEEVPGGEVLVSEVEDVGRVLDGRVEGVEEVHVGAFPRGLVDQNEVVVEVVDGAVAVHRDSDGEGDAVGDRGLGSEGEGVAGGEGVAHEVGRHGVLRVVGVELLPPGKEYDGLDDGFQPGSRARGDVGLNSEGVTKSEGNFSRKKDWTLA